MFVLNSLYLNWGLLYSLVAISTAVAYRISGFKRGK